MRIITIAVMCYCLGITAGTSHLRASMRNVRKDPLSQSVINLCVKTRRNGPQTLIVEGQEDECQQVIQRMGKLATSGACEPENHIAPLSKRQKKMVEVCLESESDLITIRLPRVIQREFKNLGAASGRCGTPFSRIEINLVDDDIRDTSISGKWMAEQVKLGASLETPLTGSPIIMEFGESRISASAGCNKIFGGSLIESTLDESDEIIHLVKISALASTRKLCHPPRIMTQERAFIKSMAFKTFSYKINADDRLEFREIHDADGEASKGELVAVFERIGSSNV